MTFAGVLKRVWIPLVVGLVMVGAGFAVARVRAVSGLDRPAPYGRSDVAGYAKLASKSVVYEVFGSAGASADISYLDENFDPRRVSGVHLPWSVRITTDSAAVVGSLVAQGNGSSLGCRIVVDGQVKAERIADEVKAFTYCRIKAA